MKSLHELFAELAAELSRVFAHFHAHPAVQAAVAAQAAAAPAPAPAPAPAAAPATPPPAPIVASTAVFEGGGTQVTAQPAPAAPGPDHYGSVLEFNGMDYRFEAPGKAYTMAVTPGGYTLSLADGQGAARMDVTYSDGTAISPPEGWLGWISWQFTATRTDTVSIKVTADTQGTIERQQW